MRTLTLLVIAVAGFLLSGCDKPAVHPTVTPAETAAGPRTVQQVVTNNASPVQPPAVHPTVTAAEMASWPRTVEQAVTNIVASMSAEDKQKVRATKKEDLIQYHHGWGTGIRNGFGLWRGNRELLADCKSQHPDGASMVIIEAVWERLQKQ
jgi:hypothetical protein